MKNTLAENMLRFGVKNLQESDLKRISEALLTESVDMMPKWGKDFTTQMIAVLKKRYKIPNFYFGNGQYYAKGRDNIGEYWEGETRPNHYHFNRMTSGGFTTLTTLNVPGIGTIPIVPDPLTQLGQWQWSGTDATLISLTYTPMETTLGNVKNAAEIKEALKNLSTNVSSDMYKKLYAASPIKSQIDTAVAALKTKPVEVREQLPFPLLQAFGISNT